MSTMNFQPYINIGCLGSVSDGKSTLVEKLTGVKTQRHSEEKLRNITKNQGYANMKIWLDSTDSPDSPDSPDRLDKSDSMNYYTTDTIPITFKNEEDTECTLVNHVSFVDCPGHQELIKVMLSSIALMDGAIVVVSVDQPLANKPQLIQHLAAAKLGRLQKIIVCMNKIDLVKKDILIQRKQELDAMLESYDIRPYAVIPTCFNKKIGLKYVVKAIMELFNPADFVDRTTTAPLFRISRSFDINKPGTNWTDVIGGVVGGSLMSGQLNTDDEIEIRPGMVSCRDGKFTCVPIRTSVVSIKTDTTELTEIVPGGLIGIRTDSDPHYCRANKLAGQVAGLVGTLPNVYSEISLPIQMVTTFGNNWKPTVKDAVSIQIGTQMTDASVISVGSKIKFSFKSPVCVSDNQHIIICKIIDKILRIVAEGTVLYSDNTYPLI